LLLSLFCWRLFWKLLRFLFCYFMFSCFFSGWNVACKTLFPFKVWSWSFALGPEEKNVVIFFNTLYYYEKNLLSFDKWHR
jgi:hypothetical protein